MSWQCKLFRADRGMNGIRKTYDLVTPNGRLMRMTATSRSQGSGGPYEVYIRYRGVDGHWSSAEISSNGSVRADISKDRNFIPDVEVVNKSDTNMNV